MKLTYTKEMEKQDKLWKYEKEDLKLMMKLHKDIEKEAIEKGFVGKILRYKAGDGEIISEVFESQQELNLAESGEIDSTNCSGYCKALIMDIEQTHNYKRGLGLSFY